MSSTSFRDGLKIDGYGSSKNGLMVVELVKTMSTICKQLIRDGKQIRLVPTMGCLHAGHASLIKRAKLIDVPESQEQHYSQRVTVSNEETTSATTTPTTNHDSSTLESNLSNNPTSQLFDQSRHPNEVRDANTVITIVSIFINPLQFNNVEDFDKYPNTFEQDLNLCQSLGVDYVFAPKCSDIYPNGNQSLTNCSIEPPAHLANDLEGKSRPGHFKGMLTVVCKLFNIIRPRVAYFGEKDYQQLVLVKDMVDSLNMDIEICPVQTVREFNRLPMSSRNSRLSDNYKLAASIMFDILSDAKEALEIKCEQYDDNHDQEEISKHSMNIDTTIFAATIAASCLQSALLNCNIDGTNLSNMIQFDYIELRCAHDLSKINYNRDIGFFDCFNGCIRTRKNRNIHILKARLLISIVIANVRLLDNVEVRLNLSEATQL